MAEQARVRSTHPRALLGAYIAELVGTFIFVFAGTAAVLAVHRLDHTTTGFTAVGDIGLSLAFGFGLLAAVYLTAGVSGAHLNPAVTFALTVNGEFPWQQAPPYIMSQAIGGMLAGLMDWYMFGNALRHSLILGSSKPGPGVTWWQATLTEFVLTAVLMVVIMATAVYKRATRDCSQAIPTCASTPRCKPVTSSRPKESSSTWAGEAAESTSPAASYPAPIPSDRPVPHAP